MHAAARLALPLCLAVATTCASAADPVAVGDTLAVGTWGGENAGAIVTDTLMHVHIGCTFGDVRGRIALDASHRFTVDGSYLLRAFPVAVGPTLPAQFSGVVEGHTLTLAIAVNDTVAKKVVALGPVTVTFGKPAEMGPCPICTVIGMRGVRRSGNVRSRRSARQTLGTSSVRNSG